MNLQCFLGHELSTPTNARKPVERGMGFVGILTEYYSHADAPQRLIYDARCIICGTNFTKEEFVPPHVAGFFNKEVDEAYERGRLNPHKRSRKKK